MIYISFSQANARKTIQRGFPGHSFRTRATNSRERRTLSLSCSEVTETFKEQMLSSKSKQKTLPPKCPCFSILTLSAGYSTIPISEDQIDTEQGISQAYI